MTRSRPVAALALLLPLRELGDVSHHDVGRVVAGLFARRHRIPNRARTALAACAAA